MKALIWGLFAVLLLGWTGLAWVSAELAAWLLTAVGTSQAGDAAQAIGNWPMPEWVALWIAPEVIQSLQAAWLDITGWLTALLPSVGSLSGVVTALVWIGWGLGAVTLLIIAGVAHWLAGKAGSVKQRLA
jgi:hypothetical protein